MLLFDALLAALGAILPLLIAAILLALLVSFGPRAITAWRQRAYDAAVADETVRLELTPIGGGVIDPERPLALIRALHTGERRGPAAGLSAGPPSSCALRGATGAWSGRSTVPSSSSPGSRRRCVRSIPASTFALSTGTTHRPRPPRSAR